MMPDRVTLQRLVADDIADRIMLRNPSQLELGTVAHEVADELLSSDQYLKSLWLRAVYYTINWS
jgi:hypothetical protein